MDGREHVNTVEFTMVPGKEVLLNSGKKHSGRFVWVKLVPTNFKTVLLDVVRPSTADTVETDRRDALKYMNGISREKTVPSMVIERAKRPSVNASEGGAMHEPCARSRTAMAASINVVSVPTTR